MGLLGEMLVRIYHEGQGQSVCTVREVLGARQPVKTTEVIGSETMVFTKHSFRRAAIPRMNAGHLFR
jgi:hypothetical protein